MKKTTLTMSTPALNLSLVLPPLSATATRTSSSAMTTQQMPSLTPILKKVIPSVVSISAEGSMTVNTPRMPHNFQQFFGDNLPFCQDDSSFQNLPFRQDGVPGANNGDGQQQKFMALGSGVIIDAAKGCVVTNNHVIDNITVTRVQLDDSYEFGTKIMGKDSHSNIALIQIQDSKSLAAVELANSDVLRMGDYTVAVSNLSGLDRAVTSSIVSTLGQSGFNTGNYENFIQMDAAINRGNSGGALVSPNDKLTDINTAILTPDGGNVGIGSAIPNSIVRNLTSQMVEFGQVRHGKLGIIGTELSSELARAMKIDAQRDAFVSQVMSNSSAAKAGTKAGDMITSLNGKPISSFVTLRVRVGTMPAGSRIALGLLRDGEPITMDLRLQQGSQTQVDSNSIFKGIEGADMSNKGRDKGVMVSDMRPNSPAAQIGLKKGDVIIDASQRLVKNITELRETLDSKPTVLTLNIQCDDNSIYLLMQ